MDLREHKIKEKKNDIAQVKLSFCHNAKHAINLHEIIRYLSIPKKDCLTCLRALMLATFNTSQYVLGNMVGVDF
jgi:hypothetical protein